MRRIERKTNNIIQYVRWAQRHCCGRCFSLAHTLNVNKFSLAARGCECDSVYTLRCTVYGTSRFNILFWYKMSCILVCWSPPLSEAIQHKMFSRSLLCVINDLECTQKHTNDIWSLLHIEFGYCVDNGWAQKWGKIEIRSVVHGSCSSRAHSATCLIGSCFSSASLIQFIILSYLLSTKIFHHQSLWICRLLLFSCSSILDSQWTLASSSILGAHLFDAFVARWLLFFFVKFRQTTNTCNRNSANL